MDRRQPTVAEVFRQYGEHYRAETAGVIPTAHRRVMAAIEQCRTAALGGHVEQCDRCGHQRVWYNSCRNRHCPRCQGLARAAWIQARQAELLDTEYFHVVFTVPDSVATIAAQNKAVVYGILFQAAAETLLTIAADPKHLGASIGFLAVLHTWGQTLVHHPHVHCVVPGGGLSGDRRRWIACRRGFFLPVRVLSRLFRRLFLRFLEKAHQAGRLRFAASLEALTDRRAFAAYLDQARQIDWVVYAKPPFAGPQRVVEYVGRYTHRVAIANERLIQIDGGEVRFRYRDYRCRSTPGVKTITLTATEFIRRFLFHVLPAGFHRIRYYGLLGNRARRVALARCRELLRMSVAAPSTDHAGIDYRDRWAALTGHSLRTCPICVEGRMQIVEHLIRHHAAVTDTS